MKVLAIDPGLTTGIATRINGLIQTTVIEFFEEVVDLVNGFQWDVVIVEQFHGQNISTPGRKTIELIAAIEAICHVKHITYVKHTPFQRKPFLAQAKKFLPPQNYMHELDALAHLFSWEYESKNDATNKNNTVGRVRTNQKVHSVRRDKTSR